MEYSKKSYSFKYKINLHVSEKKITNSQLLDRYYTLSCLQNGEHTKILNYKHLKLHTYAQNTSPI